MLLESTLGEKFLVELPSSQPDALWPWLRRPPPPRHWEGALRCPVGNALPDRAAPPERRLSGYSDQDLTAWSKLLFHCLHLTEDGVF